MGHIYNVDNGRIIEMVAIGQLEYDRLNYEQKHDPNKVYFIPNNVQIVGTISKEVTMFPKTCHRCGAPLHNEKCEYCGTEYGHIYTIHKEKQDV